MAGGIAVGVTKGDLAVVLEPGKGFVVGKILTIVMGHGHAQHLPGLAGAGEDRLAALDADVHVAANEFEAGVRQQCAGQQTGLGQDLKAVANAENRNAAFGLVLDRAHDGRVGRHGAAAEIIAISEAAGQDDQIDGRQIAIAMPNHLDRRFFGVLERDLDVTVAVGAGKDDDRCLHGCTSCLALLWVGVVRCATFWVSSVLELDGVVFDHRVGEEPGAHFLDLATRGFGIALGQFELDQLALADLFDAGEAERGKGPLHGLALWVENPMLGKDMNACFHSEFTRPAIA